jgi:flagellin FlaB
MKKGIRTDDAFTGLEAAIVLIAFVVVAAVFSYVVLGAGFFTTQKSQETIYAGVGQSTSNVEIVGPVTVKADGTGAAAKEIYFKMKLAAGGSNLDLNKMTFTISTAGTASDYVWTDVTPVFVQPFTNNNNLLENGEIVEAQFGVGSKKVIPDIGTSKQFSIEIKPSVGAPLLLQKTTPAGYSVNGIYELY